MSVRAYKIISLIYEDEETFNLWHDKEIVELLEIDKNYSWVFDHGGIIMITKDDLELAKEKIHYKKYSKQQLEWIMEIINKIEKDLGNNDYIQYYCY